MTNTNAGRTTVTLSAPLLTFAVIGLLIAKYAFHVAIPLIWVFAPWWVPIGLAVFAAVMFFIIAGLFGGIIALANKS